VEAKDLKHIISKYNTLIWLDNAGGYLCILIVFALVGTLGLVFHYKGQESHWLFTSSASIHRVHPLYGLIQKKYVIFEDNSTVKDPKKSFKQLSSRNFRSLVCSLNSYLLTIFDGVRHSPHIEFFVSSSLRSPPLYS